MDSTPLPSQRRWQTPATIDDPIVARRSDSEQSGDFLHPLRSTSLVSVERLRYLYRYEPETGRFFWQRLPGHRAWLCGKPAFTHKDMHGYFCGKVEGQHVTAGRAAWALYYGEWPRQTIDHINRDRADNRITNLRDASYAENTANRSITWPRGPEGTGVYWHSRRNRWHVYLRWFGRNRSFGYFTDKSEAIAAAKAAFTATDAERAAQ